MLRQKIYLVFVDLWMGHLSWLGKAGRVLKRVFHLISVLSQQTPEILARMELHPCPHLDLKVFKVEFRWLS